MSRIHLFEWEDQQWFPGFLRDYMTDFLQFLSNKAKLYKPVAPILAEKMKQADEHRIIDLASGGGGGLLWLNSELRKDIPELEIILTDFFPNRDAFVHTQQQADNIRFEKSRVDARKVPAHLKGFRTQFLSFHHFRPADAKAILQNAVDAKCPIGIFEAQDRSVPSLIAMLLSPVSVLLCTPFIQPFKWGRILFTYLIPIVPLCVLWDGVVSSLRTYSVKEMQALMVSLERKDSFEWTIGKKKGVLYLIAVPKEK
jgi:hypothetical protein